MRKYTLLSLLWSLLIVVGCSKDKISYDDSTSTDEASTYGTLVLPSTIYVDLSSENFNQIETKADAQVVEAGDDYLVTITSKSDGEEVYDGTYGALKEKGELSLTPATYTIYVRSIDTVPTVGDSAHFSTSEDFVIVSGLTTTIDNLSCVMSNIKVSLTLSADLLDLFKEDVEGSDENLNAEVSIGENSVSYNRTNNGEVLYYQAVEASNTLEIVLSGMYNIAAANQDADYTLIEGWKQSITGVKAGQWRNISISILNSNSGSVEFSITIDTWTYDDVIDVDVTSSTYQYAFAEAELDDPENYITDENAPVVTQGEDGSSLDVAFTIDQNSFSLSSSLQAICTNPLIVNVTPAEDATLSSMWVEFTSDNESFTALLEGALGEKRRHYIDVSSASNDYYTMTDNSFEATYAAMYQFYLYEGTHQAIIMAEDSQGRCSYSYMAIVSSNEGIEAPVTSPPTIEWRGGISFDEVYTIDKTDGLEVIIDITSQTGITAFTLEINSETLSEEELIDINLAQTMDLITPGSCEGGLQFLGFPTGDEVKGQTSLVFDITSFMPQLVTMGSGRSDFVLNVTDAGGTTTKTLQVNVE